VANPEHLAILKQGVDVWNEWRSNHPGVTPDLSEADLRWGVLSKANFRKVNFFGADLNQADLTESDLHKTDLSEADLAGAILVEANLSNAILALTSLVNALLHKAVLIGANLSRADCSQADLSEAQISGANLSEVRLVNANLTLAVLKGANLRNAYLREANFSKAKLNGAILSGADLYLADLNKAKLCRTTLLEADLRWADLSGANLADVNLVRARLINANLYEARLMRAELRLADLRLADLSEANFRGANLKGASLEVARLINTLLDNANLTDTRIWETQRAGWSIKDVTCDFVYWDEKSIEKTAYRPGEFERLYTEKTKVKLFYKDGINSLEIASLPGLIKHLESQHPNCGLRLVSIHEESGGVVVELAIEEGGNFTADQLQQLKVSLETEAQQKVEYQRLALVEREARLQLEGALRQSDAIIDKLLLRPSQIIQGNHMGNTYNVPGQAGAVGDNAHAHDNTFNQIANHLQSVDLSELAKQLGELRQAMSERQDSSPQTAIALGKVAEAEIAAQEKKPSKVVEHLKAAGQVALDAAKEIGKAVAVEAIKQSMCGS